MFTFEQLTTLKEREELLEELRKVLEDGGIETSAWDPGSPSMMHLQLDAYLYDMLLQRIASTAKNQLNEFASGDYLTLLSRSRFSNERVLAVRTEGYFKIEAQAFALPINYGIGEFEVKDPSSSFVYTNMEPIALTAIVPSASIRFQANEPGRAYNISNNLNLEPVNTVAGISITNPPYSPSASTWYEIAGADEESDESLRNRNKTKFATLQRGENIASGIEYLVRNATNAPYVAVDDSNPRGAGTVDIYVSNELETASPSQIVDAQAVINMHMFANENFGGIPGEYRGEVKAAETIEFDRDITVLVDPAYPGVVMNQLITEAITSWISQTPIGGYSFTVGGVGVFNVADLGALEKNLLSIEGVSKVLIFDCGNEFIIGPWNKLIPSDMTNITISTLDKGA